MNQGESIYSYNKGRGSCHFPIFCLLWKHPLSFKTVGGGRPRSTDQADKMCTLSKTMSAEPHCDKLLNLRSDGLSDKEKQHGERGSHMLEQMKSASHFPSPHAWSYMPLSLSLLIYCDAFKTPSEWERVSAAPGEMPRSRRSAVAIGFLTFNWVNLLYCEYKFNCHHSCFIWRACLSLSRSLDRLCNHIENNFPLRSTGKP